MAEAIIARRGSQYSTVEFKNAFSRSSPTQLSEEIYNLAATTVGNYALFGGGRSGGSSYSSKVDAYDTTLVRSTLTQLSVARDNLKATTVGNYALFGGGSGSSSYSSTVDAYRIIDKVTVYPGTKYKFVGMSSEATATGFAEINVTFPGYIKVKNTKI